MVLASGKTVVQSGESVSSAHKHQENWQFQEEEMEEAKSKDFMLHFIKTKEALIPLLI